MGVDEAGQGRAHRMNVTKSNLIKWKVRNVAPASCVHVSHGIWSPAKGNQELGGAQKAEWKREGVWLNVGRWNPPLALTMVPHSPMSVACLCCLARGIPPLDTNRERRHSAKGKVLATPTCSCLL